MKKVFLIFFALVVIFGISVIPCFAAGELVGQSNVVTVQLARPKLYYDECHNKRCSTIVNADELRLATSG